MNSYFKKKEKDEKSLKVTEFFLEKFKKWEKRRKY